MRRIILMPTLITLAVSIIMVMMALLLVPILPQGEQVIVTAFRQGQWEMSLIDVQHRVDLLVYETTDTLSSPPSLWSPDGNYIVFSVRADDGSGDVQIIDFVHQSGQSITRTIPDAYHPTWNPLSSQLAFTSFVPNGDNVLNVLNANNGDLTRIETEGLHNNTAILWTANGDGLIYYGANAESNRTLYQMTLESQHITRFPDSDMIPVNVIWSPDRRRFVYRSGNVAGSYSQLLLVELDEADRFSEAQIIQNENVISNPSWSPDGRYVTYFSQINMSLYISVYDLETATIIQSQTVDPTRLILNWASDGAGILYLESVPSGQYLTRFDLDERTSYPLLSIGILNMFAVRPN